jgi:transketolase
VLADADDAQITLIATGSEIGLALAAKEKLAADGVRARVVSMPCTQLFDAQSDDYKQRVLSTRMPRLAIEAGSPDGWWKYLAGAPKADVIGMTTFGESAPASALFKYFGFTVDNVVARAKKLLAG